MAEQIISPGVFTRENDLSFLPQGIGAIGAAIIGPTDKGPAFVPTVITSFSDFQDRFGNLSSTTYVPQTVQEYLRNAGSVTVCRVLAGGGYTFSLNSVEPVGVIAGTGGATAGTFATGKIVFQHVPSGSVAAGGSDEISIGGVDFTFVSESAGLTNTATQIFVEFPGTTATNATNLTNAINNNSTLHGLGITAVADTNDVQLSGSAVGLLSITVTTGSGGDTTATTPNFAVPTSITGGTGATLNGGLLLGLIYPSKVAGATNPSLETSVMAPTSGHVISSSFAFHVKGTGASSQTVGQFSASLNPANQDYLFNQLGYNSNNSKTGVNTFAGMPGYTYLNFKKLQESILGTGNLTGYGTGIGSGSVVSLARMSSTDCEFKGLDSPKTEGYGYATTPFIQSQLFNGVGKDLFRFHTINHGRHLCHEYKISITGLQEPADIDGVEQYSRFNVLLRRTSDRDSSVSLIESFNNVNLNPASPDFISRRIGDRYPEYNENLDKVELLGNYPNVSPHIRVEVAESVTEGSYSPKLSPKGFKALRNTFNTQSLSVNCTFPSSSFEGVQTISSDGTYDGKGYLGFKFIDKAPDNENFLQPVPTNVTELNIAGAFNVENFSGHPSSSLWSGSLSASLTATGEGGPTANQLKFSVPFQGGDDGLPPWRVQNIGGQIANNNLYGFDLSGTDKAGYKAYKKAIDILSNQDEYDINMLAMPGVIHALHPLVTNAGITMCEDRGDAFFVMDLSTLETSVNAAVNNVSGLDTNYAAVYYPWVQVLDNVRNQFVYVPPSVIVPGAIAQSDNIAAEWFAPAGLNRGILGTVSNAKVKLNQAERDVLYDNKINPIATFPQTGVCIWGQKTLQERSTALNRINVRRLLIALKKFIASSSRYLVFEQNTQATRNRFLNIVNPYLESVQSQQGLFAFRVQMDDSNNTATVIDRNQLVGAIFLQPTRTAEFIVLDFNVLPTGATFDSGAGGAGGTGTSGGGGGGGGGY